MDWEQAIERQRSALAGIVAALLAMLGLSEGGTVSRLPLPLYRAVLRVLYPVVPHTAWSLWNDLGYATRDGNLLDASWPQVDPAALAQDEIELVLQVNGKLRGRIVVPATADQAAVETAARASPDVAKHVGAAPIKRIVVVPGKLVNVVV